MKKLITLIPLLFILFTAFPQSMTLDEVISMAQEQSLDNFKAKTMYLSSYWEYKSFKASQLPYVDLSLNPITYNRKMTRRYDFDNDLEIYRPEKTLLSYANLSLNQSIPLTGGTLFFDTDFSRFVNYGDQDITTYSSTPLRIGLVQPIFAFNSLKWKKKISPLKFEMAKQDYLQKIQGINIKAVDLFFALAKASQDKEIALYEIATADTLYEIGKKRFLIASIEKEDLLNLELTKFNAEIKLAKAESAIQKARFNLNSFLGLDKSSRIDPVIPDIVEGLEIEAQSAVEMARRLNPKMLEIKKKRLEAERDLDQAKKESRFNADLSASYGLNQSADNIDDAYKDPLSQQMVRLSMDIPVLDWGQRRGQRQMKQKLKEVTELETKQEEIDFEQEVTLKVIDFNLQEKEVKSNAKAKGIADESFELTKKRFMSGNANFTTLNSSMSTRQSNNSGYLISLQTFWKYYYEVQRLTLYDYINEKPITEDFDKMVK